MLLVPVVLKQEGRDSRQYDIDGEPLRTAKLFIRHDCGGGDCLSCARELLCLVCAVQVGREVKKQFATHVDQPKNAI